jgi:hypothetical protein
VAIGQIEGAALTVVYTWRTDGLGEPLRWIISARMANAIAQEVFDSVELIPETEFHATYIYFGKGPYKGWPVGQRIELLARLGHVLRHPEVRRV